MVNVVIPMAGAGARFRDAGYVHPKPFIDVLNKPMIERVLDNLKIENGNYFLVAQKAHLDTYPDLVKGIKAKYNVNFIPIECTTEGTACTVLFARHFIDNDQPLVIANSDQLVNFEFSDFVAQASKEGSDGSIVCFRDERRDPKWSFVELGPHGNVIRVKEKEPISDLATVGIYFFSEGRCFVDNAIQMIIENKRVNNEYYTAPVYEFLIENGCRVRIYEVKLDDMKGLGTPEDLARFLKAPEYSQLPFLTN